MSSGDCKAFMRFQRGVARLWRYSQEVEASTTLDGIVSIEALAGAGATVARQAFRRFRAMFLAELVEQFDPVHRLPEAAAAI